MTAVIAFVVVYGETIDQNLQMVAEIVSDPDKLDMACAAMQKSNKFGGMLARLGHQVKHLQGKERSSVLTTVVRHLRFLSTLAVANISVRSTFNPGELKSGKVTVYLIIPPQHMRALPGLLRMWITCLLGVIVGKGLDEKNLVHFVLDEAPVLGNLQAIEDGVVMYRGYGCRFQFYFQSVGQLKTMFPNGQDQTLLSNASQTFFGTNDPATADLISQRLGDQTIFVDSGGSSDSTSWQRSYGMTEQLSRSVSTSRNWQQHARRLLKPEEVLTLDPRWAITFTPGVRPIATWLMRYYDEPWLTSPQASSNSIGRGLGMLFKSCMVLCIALAAVIGMSWLIHYRQKYVPTSPVPYQPYQIDRRYYHVR
ncbi:MAG: type IV secretory system conjugative DNA transfer family protein [Pirellulales bacterium]